jgi:acetyl esterase/lipase
MASLSQSRGIAQARFSHIARRASLLLAAVLCSATVSLIAAVSSAPKIVLDVPYLAGDRAEKLDLYLPVSRPAGTRSPALVWIHGGGWKGGAKSDGRARQVCTIAAQAGYVAVSIDYKLGTGAWPVNLQDCKNAVRFLRAKADEFGIDPARIAIGGGSAGGHLALLVGLTSGVPGLAPAQPYPGVADDVRCIVNFYGVTDLRVAHDTEASGKMPVIQRLIRNSLAVFGATSPGDEVLALASPLVHLRADSPPILTFHGREDATIDCAQAEELDRMAREVGARHRLLVLEGVGHSFSLRGSKRTPVPRELETEFLKFIEANLRSPSTP